MKKSRKNNTKEVATVETPMVMEPEAVETPETTQVEASAEEEKPIFCGSGRSLKNDGSGISIWVDLDVLNAHAKESSKGKKGIRIVAWKRQAGADQYGNTHTVKIDTYRR